MRKFNRHKQRLYATKEDAILSKLAEEKNTDIEKEFSKNDGDSISLGGGEGKDKISFDEVLKKSLDLLN